jgi:hypothetical protein
MPNKSPEPSSEQSLYEFLRKLLNQSRNGSDSAGLLAYIATLGFLAFIFISFLTLAVVRSSNTAPTTSTTTTITNTQGGTPQAK